AAEGISKAKSLGGEKTTAAARPGTGGGKEVLTIATASPADGQTVSGQIAWEVSVLSGSPSRIEFAIDGVGRGSDSTAPYAYSLDTTQLGNGSHTLTATASGSRGVKASTKVTVTVANATPEPEPSPEPEPTPELTPEPEPTPVPGGGPIYWGATIGSHLTGNQAPWDMSAVTKFEEGAGKRLSLVQFFQPFSQCSGGSCSYYGFPTTPLENVRLHGSIPVLSWSSQSIPSSLNEPDYQLSDVISGRHDAYIREFATKAKNWGHPFFLRFNWEMNGNWFPWSEGVNGNKTGEFVAAWRHVHDIFAEVGAKNVTWVWCPNVDWNNNLSGLAAQYPGDAYVDWTGLDGYNWGTNPNHPNRWETFSQVYQSTYKQIVENIAPSKPMMVGEVASSEYGGSKATWTKDMLTRVPTEYPKIRALLWFDKFDSSMDWPVETSSSATAGFAEGIKSSAYVGNSFANLSATAILPAS
ncbi:MAG TPA: Ig-like domain-containing protein, partial [Solirubrobacterales bacterium]